MNLNRRTFLRATGVSLALPWLEALAPSQAFGADAVKPPRRMVCICTPLSLHPPFFFPQDSGRDYTLTPGSAYVYNEGDLHSPRRGYSVSKTWLACGHSR